MMRKRTLDYLERLVPSASDLEGLQAGKQNVVTTADCFLFTALWFESTLYGIDLTEGYENLRKFVDAFGMTDCAMSFPALPERVPAFRDACAEGVWERCGEREKELRTKLPQSEIRFLPMVTCFSLMTVLSYCIETPRTAFQYPT